MLLHEGTAINRYSEVVSQRRKTNSQNEFSCSSSAAAEQWVGFLVEGERGKPARPCDPGSPRVALAVSRREDPVQVVHDGRFMDARRLAAWRSG